LVIGRSHGCTISRPFALAGGLTYEQQILHFLVDKVVVTFDVGFIDVQARGDPKKALYLVGTLNMLVRIQVVNWLEWISFLFSFCAVQSLLMGLARELTLS
jgi:hypothetical protein